MMTRPNRTSAVVAASTGYDGRRTVGGVALIAAAVCLLMFAARSVSADCCNCNSPYGNFCAPDSTNGVVCGQSYNGGVPDCTVNPVIVGGTCSGGNDAGGSGLNGTCVGPPTPTPTPTPVPLALGEACVSGSQCASTFCASGVCCYAPCTEQNQSCALPNSVGLCRPLGAPAPAASHTGIIALCVLLVLVGAGSLISVRHRKHV